MVDVMACAGQPGLGLPNVTDPLEPDLSQLMLDERINCHYLELCID